MALPLQDIYYTDFHDFPAFQFSRHVCPKAGLCRLSVSTETQSLQREDGRTACNVPRCNNFWCCALSLLCLVSPALQALSYLVNVNAFIFFMFFLLSCFQHFLICFRSVLSPVILCDPWSLSFVSLSVKKNHVQNCSFAAVLKPGQWEAGGHYCSGQVDRTF